MSKPKLNSSSTTLALLFFSCLAFFQAAGAFFFSLFLFSHIIFQSTAIYATKIFVCHTWCHVSFTWKQDIFHNLCRICHTVLNASIIQICKMICAYQIILKEIIDFNNDIEFEDRASKIKAGSTSVQLVTCRQTGEKSHFCQTELSDYSYSWDAVLNLHLENCLENISHP